MATRKILFFVGIITAALGRVQCYPLDILVDVQAQCGEEDGTAIVTLTTDGPVTVTAECREGDQQLVPVDVAQAVYRLEAALNTTQRGIVCSFKVQFETETVHVYSLLLKVTWEPSLPLMHGGEEERMVICNFAKFAERRVQSSDIEDGYRHIENTVVNTQNQSTSIVTVTITDILGRPIDGPLRLGRRVKLVARSDGNGGEKGIRPVACRAVAGNSRNLPTRTVLSAGCGDGYIFGTDDGFYTHGLEAISPPFNVFRYGPGGSMIIICTFAMCDDTCDGSSCRNTDVSGRRRRSDQYSDVKTVQATSQTVTIDGPDTLPFILLPAATSPETLGTSQDLARWTENQDLATTEENQNLPRLGEYQDFGTHDGENQVLARQGENEDVGRQGEYQDLTTQSENQDLARQGENSTEVNQFLMPLSTTKEAANSNFVIIPSQNCGAESKQTISAGNGQPESSAASSLDDFPWLADGEATVVVMEIVLIVFILLLLAVFWRYHRGKTSSESSMYVDMSELDCPE